MRGHFSLMALSRGLTRWATVASLLLSSISRADHEVHDIADGRYDGRIQKYQQGGVEIG